MAWFLNSLLINKWGKSIIVTAAPVLEESLKTGLAILLGGSIFFSHLVFGLAEALFDVLRPGRDDLPAGLSGLISHGIYGFLTQSIWVFSGSLWLGVVSAIVVHLLWNAGVVFLVPLRRRR